MSERVRKFTAFYWCIDPKIEADTLTINATGVLDATDKLKDIIRMTYGNNPKIKQICYEMQCNGLVQTHGDIFL